MHTAAAAPRRTSTGYRWMRRLHMWVGAWGALAALLYGFTGLVMNHRLGDRPWPQGKSVEAARVVLAVPTQARTSAEALSLWLRQSQQLDARSIRKGPPRGRDAGPEQWNLSGGNVRASWSLQYTSGAAEVVVRHDRQSWLAAFNRLHKAVGGGAAWVLLADSFALGMVLLGLSGLWMWARGRSARQIAVSALGAAVAALALVLGPALH
ncbi:MAG: PepSY-associated TM helix domain-containing protein [Mizugakiibacter sp.]|uniref:PepSY-associated TM helix domain-containing protein n=1 Tax=Mizugakiibacter sp. TaxID=1972610 RepID=UPI0031CAF1E0|nr:PepSY-associated TM helix domain-containing protein [Xanthomonadaceae bacterium]